MAKMLTPLAILFFFLCASATAQRLPTDTELRSTYCAKVTALQAAALEDGLRNMTPSQPASSADEFARSELQKILAKTKAANARLLAYVTPIFGMVQMEGMYVAISRAEADIRAVNAAVSEFMNCTNSNSVESCQSKMPSADLAARTKACQSPDWLPF